ncbi:hypothetical protein L202_01389 [Cryptococcus amylolentus CBS 6039]|uniref:Uncharacterized protein n=1 Tax=Cryptococcus amylolentus CBS 6039 TaxID=1295533 RepID=A0A1E3I3N5_9TREE|nr:hypothetical protein L202_01389 [Cryptococcus amylolentus CBS 6039]ODN83202.1 hypothetical protein L202_01389 [Cryptococcus amylolentus CBS 6039]
MSYIPASPSSPHSSASCDSDSSPPSPSILTPCLPSSPRFPSPKYATTKGFPLLPPSHPLRTQLCSPHEQSPVSPLRTPKGHPIEPKSYPWSLPTKKPSLVLNPYTQDETTASRLVHLLRIPRRLRPFLLLAICLATFSFILVSRTISGSSHASVFSPMQEGDFAKRDVYVQQAFNDHAVPGKVGSASKEVKVEPFKFENVEQEFAALMSFVTATTSNVITHTDPALPLDPSLVLDFDPASPRARADLELVQSEINTLYPLVLFGKMRDPRYRKLKSLLSQVKISPPPLVIEVDQRRDQTVFIPTIARLLGTDDLPQITLQGKSLGSYEELVEMHTAGTLFSQIEATGAVEVKQLKKKSRGEREKERLENERVLGPAPVAAF